MATLSDLIALKSAVAPEIASWISNEAEICQGSASQIRLLLNKGGNGSRQAFSSAGSDYKIAQLVLLAILVDEISYEPTAGQRIGPLKEAEKAADLLGLSYDEIVQASRAAERLTEIVLKNEIR